MSVEPRRIEPLRLAVRDARRRVAIADQDQPAVEPALQIAASARSGWRRTAAASRRGRSRARPAARARSPRRSTSRSRETTPGAPCGPPASADRAAARPASACRSGRALRTRSACPACISPSRTSHVRAQHVVDRLASADDAPRARRRPAPPAAAAGDCSSTPSPSRTRRCRGSPAGRRPRAAAACGRGRRRRCSRRPGRRSRSARAGAVARPHRLDAVERAVERRAHQLGHAGVDDDEVARRRCAASRRRRAPAARRPARRSRGPARARSAGRWRAIASTSVGDVVLGRRHAAAVVRDAEPAAEVDVLERDARRAQLAARARGQRGGRAPQRIERRDLRSDVDVDGDELERRPRGRSSRAAPRASSSGTPNLLIFRPGRDVRMALGVDVRVDAKRDARRRVRARAAIASIAIQLAGRLDVDGLQAERHGALELRRRLADAGEDDVGGREAGPARDARFPRSSWRRPRCRARAAGATIASVELAFRA